MSETVEFRLPLEAIRAYCSQHPIRRLSLFGSALRHDFGPDSDIDLLIEYVPEAKIDPYAVMRQQADLCKLIGRPVDLGTPQSLNPYIRQEVIDSAEPLYDVDGIYPSGRKPMRKNPTKTACACLTCGTRLKKPAALLPDEHAPISRMTTCFNRHW